MPKCPTCGREGLCDQCCCIHRSHEGRMRFEVCPLCHHPVPLRPHQAGDPWDELSK